MMGVEMWWIYVRTDVNVTWCRDWSDGAAVLSVADEDECAKWWMNELGMISVIKCSMISLALDDAFEIMVSLWLVVTVMESVLDTA